MATEKQLGASGVLFNDRRDFYISPQVVKELWTDVTPFTTILSNRETRQTNDPLFKMFEHRQPWVEQKCVNAGSTTALHATNDTSGNIDIDGISNLPTPATSGEGQAWVGLVFEVWNAAETAMSGTCVCTAVVDSNTISLKNLSGSTLTFVDDDVLHVIGNAHGEGTEAPEGWADELKVVWNSTQIFKTPLQITGTLLQASLRGESSELARLRLQKSQEHKMQKEKAFLFGQRIGGTGLQDSAYDDGYNDTDGSESFADGGHTEAGSNKIRTTYGIISALEKYGEATASHDYQNVFGISEASYTYGNFVDDMEKVFQYVPEAGFKRAFVGAGALGYWSKMAGTTGMAGNSGWTVGLSDMKRDSLGFNYRMLETPHGMLQLIPTPSLRGRYNKHMLVIDDTNCFHAQYRSPMYQTNIKTDNAFDGVKDQYFSDEGVGITQINSHSLIKITA